MRRSFREREKTAHTTLVYFLFFLQHRCNEIRTRCLSKLNWSWFFVVSLLMALRIRSWHFFQRWTRMCARVSDSVNVCASVRVCVCVCECVSRAHTNSHRAVLVKICCTLPHCVCVCRAQGVFYANLLSTFSSVKCRMVHRAAYV